MGSACQGGQCTCQTSLPNWLDRGALGLPPDALALLPLMPTLTAAVAAVAVASCLSRALPPLPRKTEYTWSTHARSQRRPCSQ